MITSVFIWLLALVNVPRGLVGRTSARVAFNVPADCRLKYKLGDYVYRY